MMMKAIAQANNSIGIIKENIYLVVEIWSDDKYYNVFTTESKYLGQLRKEWFLLLSEWREQQIDKILYDNNCG